MLPSIVFYSPNGHHRPLPNYFGISFVQDLQRLDQGISTSNHPQPIVCLCCQNPLEIIKTLQPNVLIYSCVFHSHERVNLGNVREDIEFDAEGDWQFKIVLNRIQLTGLNGNQGSLTIDKQLLAGIIKQSAHNQNPQFAVENQNQNPPPGTLNRDLQSEEVEEKRD